MSAHGRQNHGLESEDIFYSTREAPNIYCPLHPGAARYYREIGVLK